MSRSLQSENLQQLSNCLVSKSLSTREVSCEWENSLILPAKTMFMFVVCLCAIIGMLNAFSTLQEFFVSVLGPLTKGFLQLRISQNSWKGLRV